MQGLHMSAMTEDSGIYRPVIKGENANMVFLVKQIGSFFQLITSMLKTYSYFNN